MTSDEKRQDTRREWRRRNPEKIRQYNRDYLRRKALADIQSGAVVLTMEPTLKQYTEGDAVHENQSSVHT
jgi:hypothetical protein